MLTKRKFKGESENEGSKSQCLWVCSKDFSAGDIIFIGILKEAVKKTAEFEKMNILIKEANLKCLGWLGRSWWEEWRAWKWKQS